LCSTCPACPTAYIMRSDTLFIASDTKHVTVPALHNERGEGIREVMQRTMYACGGHAHRMTGEGSIILGC
jgi:hypothetical protein